ncbi:MAG: universal stress protein [Candidatus Binatia bacterium]|nr:universal stress protein [Candidatus Binatia bacterium]
MCINTDEAGRKNFIPFPSPGYHCTSLFAEEQATLLPVIFNPGQEPFLQRIVHSWLAVFRTTVAFSPFLEESGEACNRPNGRGDMSQLQRIVVGHDLQASGEVAVRSAVSLARRCGAALKLVYVVEPYHVYQRLSHPLTPPYSLEEIAQRAGEKLETLVTSSELASLSAEYEVRTGKPFVELIVTCRAWRGDLLVVGGPTKANGGWLGSTAERVVRKASVPVLVAKRVFAPDSKVFLVPTDFSSCAKKAAEEAISLAQSFGGRVLFFHAVDLSFIYTSVYGPELAPIPPTPVLTPADIEGEWHAFLASLPFLDTISWEKHTTEGRAATAILAYAEERQVDVIVMGTHGYTGLAHMLLGSVAEHVVRAAPCPVITVRPDAFTFTLP